MIVTLHHEMEVADASATLYLCGALHADDAHVLERICALLPVHVRTLRLDLHGVSCIADGAMNAVRDVIRYWRDSRGGDFRVSLASEHIVATYGGGRFATPSRARSRMPTPVAGPSPALTAMYL